MSEQSRRSFLGLLLRVGAALMAGPALLTGTVRAAAPSALAQGSSDVPTSVWAGRGCSATASAIELAGGSPTTPYEIDFTEALAVVVSGVAVGDLAASGSIITASPGTSWALLSVPRKSTIVTLNVSGVAVTATPDGT